MSPPCPYTGSVYQGVPFFPPFFWSRLLKSAAFGRPCIGPHHKVLTSPFASRIRGRTLITLGLPLPLKTSPIYRPFRPRFESPCRIPSSGFPIMVCMTKFLPVGVSSGSLPLTVIAPELVSFPPHCTRAAPVPPSFLKFSSFSSFLALVPYEP